MLNCSCCLDQDEEVGATFDSPALLCDACWNDWWYADESFDKEWGALFERWNKENPRPDDSRRNV